LAKLCAHHHIHKCGGTTVEALLKYLTNCSHIHVEAQDNILLSFEEVSPLIEQKKACGPQLISISSHTLRVPLNEDATWADLHITLLRDPILRLLSAFKHICTYGYGPEYTSFNDYALVSWNSNFQCRYLFEHLHSEYPDINNYLTLDLLGDPALTVNAYFQAASLELARFVKTKMHPGSRSRLYALNAIELMYLDISRIFDVCPSRLPSPSTSLNKSASVETLPGSLDIPRLNELHKLDYLLFNLVKSENTFALQALTQDLQERLVAIQCSTLALPAYQGMHDAIFLH
jgi:hypothetical protein